MMERQVNHMVRLVDDLLEVSRITRGQVELRKQVTELAPVIRSAVETSRSLIEAKQHQLAISLPPEPVQLSGDEVRLEQVFANLLNNAAKYTDPGGQIWLTAKTDGDRIIVSVRDNGIGLSAETLPKVFDLFMQADRSSERAQGGLGIGLTLVKNLVELHGGSISVRSAGKNQGSEFIVSLPRISERRMTTSPVASKPIDGRVQKRVLVVDDNQDAAASLAMLLKVLGMEVKVANDGPTALDLIATMQPHVVLLDIGMPGMDGFAVARRIREQAEFNATVLVALTGWGQAKDRERTREAGFNHHLVKPADIATLTSLLVEAPV
jgi:CheY-like chemotaxis protein